jgi:uroporphyrinogen-III synthase
MSKKVLLTRSKEDNKYLHEILTLRGYSCIDCSLLRHHNLSINVTILDAYTNIIVTSKRAAELLPFASGIRNAWVVGNVSAEILSKKGYNICYIASSAAQLKEQIPADIYTNSIYLAGNHISTNMPSAIKIVEIYKVKYKESLSPDEIQVIKNGLDYILLYSENCAKTLIRLIVENELLKYLENTVVIAISSKVEMVVKNYFKNTIAALRPEEILEKLE